MRRLVFLALVTIELAHTATAILQHRAPSGHDGFQYFTLQYFFLNNAAQGGGVAQWIPYMSHGTVATLWYGIQGSFLQQVLLWVGPLVRHADLLTVFHLGVFVDEMILLTGTWLLARRFLRSPAACFVAISVVGSSVWLDQPYWNFRLYYALPLVIELGHRFLDTGRWRWFFLAANLLALQSIGNLPYFVPLAAFVVFLYFVWFAAVNLEAVAGRLRSAHWGWPAAAAVSLGAVSFVLAYACMTIGTDQLVTYSPGRNPDGTTVLDVFLTYGGGLGAQKWLDLVLNVSPWLDMTVYAGILVAPLLLAGVFMVDRRRVHFVLLAATLLLFTLGTVVATASFYLWPGMKYFRHIGLVSPLVRVLFCFVAGIGFEALFDARDRRTFAVRTAAIGSALLLLGGAWLAQDLARSEPMLSYMDPRAEPGIDRPDHVYEPRLVARRLRSASIVALAGACVVGVVPILLRRRPFTGSEAARATAIAAVLAFVAVDVYRFKFEYLIDRSEIVPAASRFVTRAAPMPFARRRTADLQAALFSNPRLQATLSFNRALLLHTMGRGARGTIYWSNHAFFFTDEAGSSFRMDSWLRPVDRLMRTAWGAPLDQSMLPATMDLGRLRFPVERAGIAAIAGVTADKIRFFSRAYSVASPAETASIVRDRAYAGNLLFVSDAAAATGSPAPEPWTSAHDLAVDDSRALPYEVLRFDANRLTIKVTNDSETPGWMSYADAWHPSWTARVNGRDTPVYAGNLAYKAIPIQGGENLIEFRFGSRWFSALSALAALNASFWLAAVAVLMWRAR